LVLNQILVQEPKIETTFDELRTAIDLK